MSITYKLDLLNLDWDEVNYRIAEDDFDNSRTSE